MRLRLEFRNLFLINRRLLKLNSQSQLKKVMKMTSTQWKNLNNWKTRQWLPWQKSSRTSGLGGTQKYKFKSGSNYSGSSGSGFRGNRGGSSSGSYNKSGYKTWMVDRSKFKCYNCNEPEHFVTECRKTKQMKGQRESYDELKQKYVALLKKKQGKAYIAEGKSWDDSDNDDIEEFGNLALMADTTESTPTSSKVSFLSTVKMSNSDYRQTVEDLGVEMFNILTSMIAASEENEKVVLKCKC